MKIKAWFQRFRSWQKEPRTWSDEGLGEHCCANCGHTFTGNYCPVCGQSAKEGRVDWLSLHRIVMMVWGLDSRSMLYSLWQLIWRPGYMIGEYISGRRQVSFPPVKMLFILAIFYAVFIQLTGLDHAAATSSQQDQLPVLTSVVVWLKNNPAWGMMALTMNMVLPTWALFRFSPRHTRHTLPEDITVQLFMSVLALLIVFVNKLVGGWLFLLPFVYYYFAYRQLFGYRFWGTMWRLATCFTTGLIVMFVLLIVVAMIFESENFVDSDENGLSTFWGILFMLAFVAAILFVGALIGRRTYRKRLSQS